MPYIFCMYTCMHACMQACKHVCMYACMHVCTYARMQREGERECCASIRSIFLGCAAPAQIHSSLYESIVSAHVNLHFDKYKSVHNIHVDVYTVQCGDLLRRISTEQEDSLLAGQVAAKRHIHILRKPTGIMKQTLSNSLIDRGSYSQ